MDRRAGKHPFAIWDQKWRYGGAALNVRERKDAGGFKAASRFQRVLDIYDGQEFADQINPSPQAWTGGACSKIKSTSGAFNGRAGENCRPAGAKRELRRK